MIRGYMHRYCYAKKKETARKKIMKEKKKDIKHKTMNNIALFITRCKFGGYSERLRSRGALCRVQ